MQNCTELLEKARDDFDSLTAQEKARLMEIMLANPVELAGHTYLQRLGEGLNNSELAQDDPRRAVCHEIMQLGRTLVDKAIRDVSSLDARETRLLNVHLAAVKKCLRSSPPELCPEILALFNLGGYRLAQLRLKLDMACLGAARLN